jgi:hypothetical protein
MLPRHIGLLYSTPLLIQNMEALSAFRNTLHLYAAPLILACLQGSSAFFNYPLCLFQAAEKSDGAWDRGSAVVTGLATFLGGLKRLLTPEQYQMAERAFFLNYLGADAWLRRLIKDGAGLPSEEEIRRELAEIVS